MNTWQARIFWALGGALIGLGAVTIFSIGIGLVLLGAALLLYAAGKRMAVSKKMTPSDSLLLWIALAAMGFAPALLLTVTYVTADQNTVFFSGYWSGVLLFVAIGLAGIAGGVITTARRQTR
jgi:hypothetical protein